MLKTITAFFLLFLLSFTAKSESLEDFTLPIYGKKESFNLKKESREYKRTLINFWASWCTACIQELAELEALKKSYEKDGVLFIAINAGEKRKKIKKFLRRYKFSYLILEDKNRDVSKKLKVTDLPKTIVIDSDMKILFIGNRPPKKINYE